MVCSYIGGYVGIQQYKNIRILKIRILGAKSTAFQFVLSKKLQIQMYSWIWKLKEKFNICDLLKSSYIKY